MVDIVVTGDQIGTYSFASGTGNGTARVVTLSGVQALGPSSTTYIIRVTQLNGATQFNNGQFVRIFESDGVTPVTNQGGVNPDAEQGRAAGDEHIFFPSLNIVVDLNGLPPNGSPGDVVYDESNENAVIGEGDDDGQFDFSEAICFANGTMIATPAGDVAVENLAIGDIVFNKSGDEIEIQWIGHKHIPAKKLAMRPNLRPVKFAMGSLGENKPNRDLIVSRQHRIFMNDWRAEILVDTNEYFAPAASFLNDTTVTMAPIDNGVTYYHIMFDKHEILISNGQPTESFYPGEYAISALDEQARAEILEIFPNIQFDVENTKYAMAALCLKPDEMGVLRS